nr:hypothetical chloroplast RF66 [Apopellia endiviifolia]
MNHMELGPSTIIGVGLVIVGIFLYALRFREPHVSRYYDFLFSSIGLLCGGILFFQGWRLDPILLLSQILLSGTTVFFIAESLYLRNNSNRVKYREGININLNFESNKYFYRNFKLKKKLFIKGWDRINYTTHVSCKRKKTKGH